MLTMLLTTLKMKLLVVMKVSRKSLRVLGIGSKDYLVDNFPSMNQ